MYYSTLSYQGISTMACLVPQQALNENWLNRIKYYLGSYSGLYTYQMSDLGQVTKAV